jgi:hypothetical protein
MEYSEISDLSFHTNGKATNVIRGCLVAHCIFEKLYMAGPSGAAIQIDYGYTNTIDKCTFLDCGTSIMLAAGDDVNLVNDTVITNCKMYGSTGLNLIGIICGRGQGVLITGCAIECNVVGGIFLLGTRGVSIHGNYFERNGTTGYAYAAPEALTVKADIHLLANASFIITNDAAYPMDGIEITGNGFQPGTDTVSNHCVIFASSLNGISIKNNSMLDLGSGLPPIVGMYIRGANSKVERYTEIAGNVNDRLTFLGTPTPLLSVPGVHLVNSPTIIKANLSETLNEYTILSGSTGTLAAEAGTVLFQHRQVYSITDGDHVWQNPVDLATIAELQGEYVWFGMWYQTLDANVDLDIVINGTGGGQAADTSVTSTPGVWSFKSVVFKIPFAGTEFAYFQRAGAGVNKIYLTDPIIAIVGDGANKF